ncbi:MAG: SLATT domain-containing protein [Acidimicrobiia bacterium]|nr:SLATT domain-containing protein [Acidimicrobiia bacterium]MDH5237782.1 SLATT domain-containing protein [Acidimicrobiia bacterium]
MTTHAELESVLALYDEARVGDQVAYYEQRIVEYERSAGQTSIVTEVLLLGAAFCGVLGAVLSERSFGIAAAGLAAVAAAINAWADTVGFATNAELFRAARNGLIRTRPTRPTATESTVEAVDDYIDRVEGILLGEVGAWGDTWQTGGHPPVGRGGG